jgi:hypothetical protein
MMRMIVRAALPLRVTGGMCRRCRLRARQRTGRTYAMRREYVEMTWGEIMAALATIGIMAFLLLA